MDEQIGDDGWQEMPETSQRVLTRAVVADDGYSIRLVLYRADEVAVIVPLDVSAAIGLAGRLIDSGSRHLQPSQPPPPPAG